jgi:hypothetical protein
MKGTEIALSIDRSRCVLCGGPNECAMALEDVSEREAGNVAKEEPCWCVGQVFPKALTEGATARDGGASCICRSCLDEA